MSKFEPGKLALIIGARTESGRRFIGKVVTLEKFAPVGKLTIHRGMNCAPTRDDCWLVAGDIESFRGHQGIALYAQKHLIPLEDPDQFRDKEFNVDLYIGGKKVMPCDIKPVIIKSKV